MFSIRMTSSAVAAIAALGFAAGAASAAHLGAPTPDSSFVAASTNVDNEANGEHWVELVSSGVGFVELNFINQNAFPAYFEYRLDGAASPHDGQAGFEHPIVLGTYQYDYVVVGGNDDASQIFNVSSFVDIRSAFGPESDYFFDWTRFEATPAAIPLPAALPMLAAGLGLLGLIRRRA